MYIGTNLDLGLNELRNVVMQGVATLPDTGAQGQVIYNTTAKALFQYNGDEWEQVGKAYTLPTASATELGGIKIGTGLNIDADGKVTVSADSASVKWENIVGIPEEDIMNVQADWDETDTASDAFIKNKPTIPETAEDVGAIPATEKGAANGVATLDENSKIPAAQLPSYVDDVIDGTFVDETTFNDLDGNPVTPESGVIYVDVDTLKVYRWSGTIFAQINGGLTLGETASTAFRGDYGKLAYDHSQIKSGNPHNTTIADMGITATEEELNSLPEKVTELETTMTDANMLEITEGVFAKTDKTKDFATDGTIFSVMVYDSVTNEQCIVDVTFNAARDTATLAVGTAPTNDLKVVIAWFTVNTITTPEPLEEVARRSRNATATTASNSVLSQQKPSVRRAKVRR